ncbi:hypothetical protein HY632_00885 [Candidatus Uhrbacteria bacterium]|nr:hypothetical protein [Candidatus Uhrbacteria bacterium]
MSMREDVFATWVRRLAWGAALALLVFLAVRDVQLDRRLEVAADTVQNRTTNYLTAFGPPVRVAVREGSVWLVGQPVYSNLRLPRWFHRIVLEVRYENPQNALMRVGVRTHPTQWSLLLKTIDTGGVDEIAVDADVTTTREGAVTVARIPFTLLPAWQVERNTYRLVFVHSSTEEQPLRLRGVRVIAERDSWCWGSWCI